MAGGLPGLIYHPRAQSNEFLFRAVTGISFLTKRVSAVREMEVSQLARPLAVRGRTVLLSVGWEVADATYWTT
jgi:hypothetical protein